MSDSDETIDRKEFLSKSARLIAGGATRKGRYVQWDRR
jgi:hypothetical protein